MAVTAATSLSDFSGFLTRAQSQAIFEKAARSSVVQRLAREIPLSFNGQSIPVVTGRLVAGWVSEAAKKPASSGAMSLKTMDPKKLAVVAVVSSEVVRANPGGYMQVIQNQIGEAFALAFDKAALYDQGPAAYGSEGAAGGGPFATNLGSTTNAVEIGTGTDIFADFVSGLSLVLADGFPTTGYALDDRMEPLLLSARDGNDRPLFVDSITDNGAIPFGTGDLRTGRLLGRPAVMGGGVYSGTTDDVEAIGGDWSQAAWGVVGGINYALSTEATVTINGALVSLWENNLVAVRAEAEYGFLVNDTNAFVKFTNAS